MITTIQYEIMYNVQYNKIIHDLKRFSESLSANDEIVFLNMISDCYRSYRNSIHSNMNINKKSQSSYFRNISLFMVIIFYQQKQIDLINNFLTKEVRQEESSI